MLRAKLLAPYHVLLNDLSLSHSLIGKGMALFTYLSTSKQPCPRTTLLDLLWSDVTEKQARENLRSLLYTVRQILGDYLLVTRQSVALNRDLPYWIDVEVFSDLTNDQVEQDPALLSKVLDLYKRDFLEGFYISNAPVFEAWLTEERRRLRNQAIVGWQKFVQHAWARQKLEDALSANTRLLGLAPWHEEAHRNQMRLLVETGQRSAALTQYDLCRRQLREELDTPPSPETIALYEQIKSTNRTATPLPKVTERHPSHSDSKIGVHVYKGTMPSPRWFLGRQEELKTLHHWVVTERCRAISILGMGGQGKTTLAAQLVQTLSEGSPGVEPPFEGIIWHSLLNTRSMEDILHDWIYQLSNQQISALPPTLDRQLDLLSSYLQRRRFLFVIDNAESFVASADANSSEEYADHARIWQIFLTSTHQCCLLVTSRKWMTRLRNQYEHPGIFRRLILEGLPAQDGIQLLKNHGLHGSQAEFAQLQQIYSGNPLALDLIGQAIDELFDGNIQAFIAEESPFLGDVNAVLDQQFSHLTPLEQEVLTWLALEQEPVSSQQLWKNLLAPPSKREYLTALSTLLNRSLIQQQGSLFGLQDIILEYVRNRLLEELYEEITQTILPEQPEEADAGSISNPSAPDEADVNHSKWPSRRATLMRLNRYALNKAQAKEYIRDGNKRLLVAPLLKRLLQYWGGERGVKRQIQRILSALRVEQQSHAPMINGYAAGNLLHLLLQISDTVCGFDFSHLTLRQVDLRNAQLHSCNLADATLDGCKFTSDFTPTSPVAFHPGGEWLAVGTLTGTIRFWHIEQEEFFDSLEGDGAPCAAMVISSNARWLVSSSPDNTIDLWDLETHHLRFSRCVLGEIIRPVAFSVDSRWFAVTNRQGITLFSAESGEEVQIDLNTEIKSLAFSPDGQWLVGGAIDGDLYLWPMRDLGKGAPGAPRHILSTHAGAVEIVLFSPNGAFVYTVGSDGLIRQWEIWTAAFKFGPPRQILRATSHLRSLAVSADGGCLAASDADGLVYLWETHSGQPIERMGEHRSWVSAVAFQPRPTDSTRQEPLDRLVTVGADQRILTWEIDRNPGVYRGRLSQRLEASTAAQNDCTFSPDGRSLLTVGSDRQLRIWDVATGQLQAVLHHDETWITALALSPKGDKAARPIAWSGGDHTGRLSSYSAITHEKHRSSLSAPIRLEGHGAPIFDLCFSPDGQILASGSQDRTVCLWDGVSGSLLQELQGHTDVVWAVVFSPDGQILASAGRDGAICLWTLADSAESGRPKASLLGRITEQSTAVRALGFTPDGQCIVSVSDDQTLCIFNRSGQIQRVLTGHTDTIRGFAISPQPVDDQLTMTSCDQSQHLRIWNIASGETIHVWQEAGGKILRLAYSPDGKIVAGANLDGYIRLWDVKTGAVIRTIEITKPYAGTEISCVNGVTAAQKAVLLALGAVDGAVPAFRH
jgi:WD40 repeat protein/DNA-binding SARP family transcriptional activator